MPRYAAIDIGSNSIRMEAAEVAPGQPVRILASDREVTRLGESVFRTGAVSEEALRQTCAVLSRMAGLYRKLDVENRTQMAMLACQLGIERPAQPNLKAWFERLCARPAYKKIVDLPLS